ncbi:hypothetical protein AOL_s00193g123 [Orbilia oligospora ATCC 24927]|uniref:Uncharacterized protein n=1 Tax=Arthrobotrys oligospora (strain ATCC 24927 / CBS 115.81 / DSM 1491) TaxID=756982 RepID=G1XRC4_ARTOA|nr:hypothetical protein AOL_s00193g123 [Orbilia oligospora ATCC 24927]EGX44395.1 hypothetical protein AOL_s00193g123 [Orbilia oligospora ATCC 24927]
MNPTFRIGPSSTETVDEYLAKTRVSDVTITNNRNASINLPPKPLQRFFLRTLLLIVAPITVTGLYLAVWLYFMVFNEGDLKYANIDHQWIFYAWFAVATFGLNWSKDGLAGIEVAMLRTPYWQARNDTVLMMHMQNHWGGPAGWIHWALHIKSRGKLYFPKLFTLLSSVSVLIVIGLPLSGLTLNITEGFVASSTSPLVIGRMKENFYDRKSDDLLDSLLKSWIIGSFPIVPGYGILYTPKNVSRSDYDNLDRFPNTLPLTKSIPEIFLAPQAEYPIAGRPWGLRATYNCSIVEDVSTFTILNERPSAFLDLQELNYAFKKDNRALKTPSGGSITPFFTSGSVGPSVYLNTYAEIGRIEDRPDRDVDYGSYWKEVYNGSDIYYNNHKGVLEYALWQIRRQSSYNETQYRPGYKFNETLEPTIKGMSRPTFKHANGTWVRNTTFFRINTKSATDGPIDGTADLGEYFRFGGFPDGEFAPYIISVMDPIGVRCEYTSAVGTAKLEPETSSFSSFVPEPPSWDVTLNRNTPLGYSAVEVLGGTIAGIFTSTGAPPPVTISNTELYESFVQPRVLLKSIMLFFGLDALHLMYDSANGFEGGWRNENLTSSTKGNIITPGVVPPSILLIFFVPWTIISLILAASYGFRPRLSDKLDFHSIVQLREELEDRPVVMI